MPAGDARAGGGASSARFTDRWAGVMEEIRTPAICDLEEIDDEYIELERQYERERLAIWRRYDTQCADLLDKRRDILVSAPEAMPDVLVTAAAAAAAAAGRPAVAEPCLIGGLALEPPRSRGAPLASGGLADGAGAPAGASQWWLPASWMVFGAAGRAALEAGAAPAATAPSSSLSQGDSGAARNRGGGKGSAASAPATATPVLPGFWRVVLQNSTDFQEDIERHDEPVLDYLSDVRSAWIDDGDRDRGFRIEFFFGDNPYFSNAVLEKVYHTERPNQYTRRVECVRIVATAIDWKPGRNATVEMVVRRPKQGSMRRRAARARKEEVPRDSFFRTCFRSLGADEDIPEEELEDSEPDGGIDLMACLLVEDYQRGMALRDYIIPHAVRWYTGEACDDDDDGSGSEDEDAADPSGEDGEEEACLSDGDEDDGQDADEVDADGDVHER